MRKSQKNNQQRQIEIQQKVLDRKKSIEAQIDTTNYDAGAFY